MSHRVPCSCSEEGQWLSHHWVESQSDVYVVAEMRTESETDIDENAKIEIRSDTRSDSDVAMASPTARDMLPADLTKQVVTCK